MEKVLITGAGGKIGSVLTERLEKDYDLFLLDKKRLDKDKSYRVDLSSRKETLECLEEIGNLGCVIHLAADSNVEASWSSILENNIKATYNLFEASRGMDVEKIIFASSNHVTGFYEKDSSFEKRIYRGEGDAQISTRDELRPDSLYGLSKVLGEQMGRYYSEEFGLNVICIRIGTFNEINRPQEKRHLATWISHRDFTNLIKKSMESKIDYGVYYGVSDNQRRIWDISNAENELGYVPKDSAEDFWEE